MELNRIICFELAQILHVTRLQLSAFEWTEHCYLAVVSPLFVLLNTFPLHAFSNTLKLFPFIFENRMYVHNRVRNILYVLSI